MARNEITRLIKFIRNTFGEPNAPIPLHAPRFIGNEKKYVNDCIDSSYVSSVGEYVGKFERACAKLTGSAHAVATVNGTAALHLALMLAGVKHNDEVITQPLTFIATANAIAYNGAVPVFVDVDRDTLGLSPAALEEWLNLNASLRECHKKPAAFNKTSGRRIAAIIPMHTFGHPVRMDAILSICNRWHIPCIEDAAESLGSYYKKRHTGTLGLLGILSFNGNKVATCGGGGMILTSNENLARQAKHLTTQAKIPHPWEYVHDQIGYNYRLTNINAALGCAQLESLPFFIREKRKLAKKYASYFKNSPFRFVAEPKNCRSNYWLNTILAKDRRQRDEILNATNSDGVMTRPAWELMHRLSMFQNSPHGPLKKCSLAR